MSDQLVVSTSQREAVVVHNYVGVANNLVVVTHRDAQAASDINTFLALQIKEVEKVRKEIIAPAKKAYEEYKQKADDYCNLAIVDMTQARMVNLVKIGNWQKAEDARIAKENAEREKLEREARQKADREAESERAKAEVKRIEFEKKAEQAAKDKEKAEAEGDTKAVKDAAEKLSKATSDAITVEENIEHKVSEIHQEAVATTGTQQKESTKVAGMTMRDNWSATHIGFDEGIAKMALIRAVANGRFDLAAFLTVNMSALNQTARAMKKNFNVAGFKAVNKPTAVGAKR